MSQTGAPIDLSILMPAYNEERTIERAIEEVLAVEYPVSATSSWSSRTARPTRRASG